MHSLESNQEKAREAIKKIRPYFSIENNISYFSIQTQENIKYVFSTAVRILRYRYIRKQRLYYEKLKRKKKKEKRIIYLKRSDVSNALMISDFHFSHSREVMAKDHMATLGYIEEKDALKYYEHFVMGKTRDRYGREIVIDEEGMKFLYKQAGTGEHIINSDNYERIRGKRLHWIKPTIEQTEEIYENHERNWTSYYYIGTFIIPYTDDKSGEKLVKENYLFIVVRKEADKSLKFITAYPIDKYGQFLKRIESAHPYTHFGS